MNIDVKDDYYTEISKYLKKLDIKSILLVCDSSIEFLKINKYFKNLQDNIGIKVVRFSNFQPNPHYESVVEGISVLIEKECQAIIAVGGGSAIDVAKCIKLYSNMNHSQNYLKQSICPNDMPFVAMPTTAGSGSESTRFAVIYYEGEKQSISSVSCIPDVIVMDPSVLKTLPMYQKSSTMLDALCHATESFWSINSTEESKEYSSEAIHIIMDNMDQYLDNNDEANAKMLMAANIAGKAINIAQTTAGHAMCYKLTSMYGIAHGHAAALCVKELWEYMLNHIDECIDPRGTTYLNETFNSIAQAYGCNSTEDAIHTFNQILNRLNMTPPKVKNQYDFEILKTSVNPVRLKNNPINLSVEIISRLYNNILV